MPIQFDVETTGFQAWSGVHYPFMFQFKAPGEDPVYFKWSPDHQEHNAEIQAWFDRAAVEGIEAWNGKFDRAFGEAAGFTLPPDGMWHDGMIKAHVINEQRSVALKSVATELFGEGADELQKQVKKYLTEERARRKKAAKEAGTELIEPNYSDVPDEIMVPYALEDVILTEKVEAQYGPLIDSSPDLSGVVEFERKVFDALYAVEKRGIPADMEGYRKLELEVIDNLETLEQRCLDLAAEGGVDDFNPRSTPQIIEALKGRKADMSYMSTKNGKLSADKENLEAVDDELATAILEFRSEFKVLTTYVRPMIGRHYDTGLRAWREPFIAPDGKIHSTYRQLGARTGRMSSADPNMQNQPRDDLRLRYNIVADEGMALVAADLSNIEMRLFAAYAGSGRLLDAVREGADLHTMTAEFLGIRDRARSGGYVESARQRGKTFNFSIIYGGGLRTIRRQQRCSQDEARKMRNRYYDAYPEVARLQNRIEYKLADQGYIQTLFGRRMRGRVDEAYKYVNYLVQGTAAEILKDALIACHADGLPVVACVHDELICHVDKKDAPEVAHLLSKHLTRAAAPGGKLWDSVKNAPIVPLEAEAEIVQRWSEAKNPDFKPKWATK